MYVVRDLIFLAIKFCSDMIYFNQIKLLMKYKVTYGYSSKRITVFNAIAK